MVGDGDGGGREGKRETEGKGVKWNGLGATWRSKRAAAKGGNFYRRETKPKTPVIMGKKVGRRTVEVV